MDETREATPSAESDTEESDTPDDPDPPESETVIDGRYRLETRLGGGGMGEVYRAEHTRLKKKVAVKILTYDADGEHEIVERFRREATAAAHLDHPNICSATDFGETDEGEFYLVMEYVEGASLQDVIDRRGALPVDEAVAIADGIAAALEAARELDVVHRDLKPDNVMLVDDAGEEPRVKVVDFGVAHVEFNDEMTSLTKTGAVFGTPTYMSPEQAAGDPVDHRADLYGLGAVLYEMLTGRGLFDVDQPAKLMAKHIMEEPAPPSDVREEGAIPAALEALVVDLLAKDPEDRPDSAGAVRRRLDGEAPVDAPSTDASPTPATDGFFGEKAGTLAARGRRAVERGAAELKELLDGSPTNVALLVAGGALLAMMVPLSAATLYLVTADSPDEIRESLQSQRASFASRETVDEAVESLDDGRPERAVEQLEALIDERGNSARDHLYYLLGEAHRDADAPGDALEAYTVAARKDGDYVYASGFLDQLAAAFDAHDEALFESAREVADEFSDYDPIRRRIATVAWKSSSDRARRRAQSFLGARGLLGSLPDWQRLSVELRRADDCEGWERAIDALVDLGDPRGARILKIYADKPRRGCGKVLKMKDCYDCIRDDLDEGIEALESGT